MKKILLIQGSARVDGDTASLVNHICNDLEADIVTLADKSLGFYKYGRTAEDDFIGIIRDFITNFDTMIMVTPIYWYTISGQLKVFLDRFTELLKDHKEMGRRLRGKSLALISCSNSDDVSSYFEKPISASAEYLGMNYLGYAHGIVNDTNISESRSASLDSLIKKLKSD